MWSYNQTNELYHYGVPGMKWGKRKAKEEYKSARKEFRKARREAKLRSYGIGIKGIKRAQEAEQRYYDADTKMTNAKIKYKTVNSKNPDKKERKLYVKEIGKQGLAGSAADKMSGGRSTRLYNDLVKRKGQEYADGVMKSVQNRSVASIAASAAVAVGSTVALAILQNKYK